MIDLQQHIEFHSRDRVQRPFGDGDQNQMIAVIDELSCEESPD